MGAGVAFAAVHLGFNGHPLTHLELGDSLPQRRDLAGDLVALGDRVLGVGCLPWYTWMSEPQMPMRLIFTSTCPARPWERAPCQTGSPWGPSSLPAAWFLASYSHSFVWSRPVCREAGRVKSIYIMRVWEGKVKRIFVKNAQNIR